MDFYHTNFYKAEPSVPSGIFAAEPDMEKLAQQRAAIEAVFAAQEDAFFTSGRMLDHGVIDPRDTRKVLGFLLETLWEREHRTTNPNAFGVARM